MNKNPIEALLKALGKLSLQQKLLIGFVVVFAVVVFIGLMVFINQPSYSTLYTNLAQEDASKVVDFLNNKKIPYKIDNNGTTIKVPKEKVYESRLSLAGQGIPSSGIVGYEIFDKSTLGMSDFMQKLNYKRALEGELARTIMQEEGIKAARVHIVIPQKTVFKDEQKEPTASVVLKLRGNYTMTASNINAILNLVSSSVEGLKPDKVTLIDTKGHLLSKEVNDNSVLASSSDQYDIKKSVENYLSHKAQSLLDNVLGYGNAIVQVNADLNFNQVEKTMESYDPDSQVAISEQTIKSENSGKSLGDTTGQVSQNNTVNYEINKTIEKVVQGTGNILRLSVAAVINDVPKEVKKGDQTEITYEPRSSQQMKKLEDIIKNSVGIDPHRHDQFSIVNFPFEQKETQDLKVEDSSVFNNVDKYVNLILMFAAIVAAMFLLKGLMSRLKNEKLIIGNVAPSGGTSNLIDSGSDDSGSMEALKNISTTSVSPLGDIESEFTNDGARTKNQKDKVANYVSTNPQDAAKLINAWLKEDE